MLRTRQAKFRGPNTYALNGRAGVAACMLLIHRVLITGQTVYLKEEEEGYNP